MKIGKVLIADDHELVIDGIRNLLHESFIIEDIITFTEPEKILNEIKKERFDLYILDLEFKEMSGFALIESIREDHPESRIIVVTMHEEIWNINYLLKLKVDGIVLKKESRKYLNEAIVSVMSNNSFLCPRFEKLCRRSVVGKRLNKTKNSRPTQSELNVLKYIVEGYSSKEIAIYLSVTEDTIEAHRKNLFIKLDARNVAHLVSIAIRQRLVE
jgi:DNA-binding NarL/FixJ family response regulator